MNPTLAYTEGMTFAEALTERLAETRMLISDRVVSGDLENAFGLLAEHISFLEGLHPSIEIPTGIDLGHQYVTALGTRLPGEFEGSVRTVPADGPYASRDLVTIVRDDMPAILRRVALAGSTYSLEAELVGLRDALRILEGIMPDQHLERA